MYVPSPILFPFTTPNKICYRIGYLDTDHETLLHIKLVDLSAIRTCQNITTHLAVTGVRAGGQAE